MQRERRISAEGGARVAILNKMIRGSFSKNMTFEQKIEGERMCVFLGKEHSKTMHHQCKGPEAQNTWGI